MLAAVYHPQDTPALLHDLREREQGGCEWGGGGDPEHDGGALSDGDGGPSALESPALVVGEAGLLPVRQPGTVLGGNPPQQGHQLAAVAHPQAPGVLPETQVVSIVHVRKGRYKVSSTQHIGAVSS